MKKTLLLAMTIAMGITASAYAANPFSDVPAGHWAYDAVNKLAAEGVSPYKISMILKKEKILIPRAYQALETGRYNNCYDTEHPYDWCNSTVTIILKNRVYLGHMVNNKSTTKSYKNRKLVKVPESEWIEVKTHMSRL